MKEANLSISAYLHKMKMIHFLYNKLIDNGVSKFTPSGLSRQSPCLP